MCKFVNDNAANYSAAASDLEAAASEFEMLFEFDNTDETADPVIVYMNGNVQVAWYDLENRCGYIVK